MAEENAKQIIIETIRDNLETATLAQLGTLLQIVRGYLGA